jgi:hypothetical protein
MGQGDRRMNDKFEIEVHSEGVHVWVTKWNGVLGLAADIMTVMTPQEIAQEIYELIARNGFDVKFKEG